MKTQLISALLLATVLAGCGGGVRGPSASPDAGTQDEATTVPAIPAGLAISSGTRRFDFTWNTVAGATNYRLLEDLDGAGPDGASQAGPAVATNAASYMPAGQLHTRLNAQYRVQACNAAGCSAASLPVAPDLNAAIGYFKASNTGGGDSFGDAVALSSDGSTLAVGAIRERSHATGANGDQADNSMANAGAVYVYVRDSGGTWTQQAYLKASNTGAGDGFGQQVALSADGSTLAVAAPAEASASAGVDGDQADNSAANAGAVYVFTRGAAGTWSQQAYVKASNASAGDFFGKAVSLSGDGSLLAVGAYLERSAASGIDGNQADNSLPNAGAAYLFRRAGATWSQEAYVKASNPRISTFFGAALALSSDGGTLAVAGSQDPSAATGIDGNQSDASAHAAGAVYVFVHGSGGWSQQAYVKASNTGANDIFGSSLALSADGGTIVVAAYQESSAATGVDGNQADDSAAGAGAAYVFVRAGTAWSQQAYLKASNAQAGDALGWSVALSADGSTLAIGAAFEGSGSAGLAADQADNSMTFAGAVYLFKRTGPSWAQAAYLKAPNPSANATFGKVVALSGDGATLVGGAPQEPGGASGIQGNQADTSQPGAGAVYMY